MKFAAAILMIITSFAGVRADEPTVVPPEPPLEEIDKQAQSAAIVLVCRPNKEKSALEIAEVLKGQELFEHNQAEVAKMLPSSDPNALSSEGFRELVFIRKADTGGGLRLASSLALWPTREEQMGPQKVIFQAHDYAELKRVVAGKNKQAQQGVAPQSATRSESDSEGGDKPEPEAKPRPR